MSHGQRSSIALRILFVSSGLCLLWLGDGFWLSAVASADEPVGQLTPLADTAPKKSTTPTALPRSAPKQISSDTQISPATLDAVKQATVFIRTKRGKDVSSGSGFVVSNSSNGRTIVATNHHVVGWVSSDDSKQAGKPPVTPRRMAAELKDAEIEVVFHSGTTNEQTQKAEVLAADPSNDLCLLEVKDMRKPPQPIDFVHTPELYETMPLYTFGFPFGEALALAKGNPAITVGRASVSSLRLDDERKLALVQIDGSINPGNSGGPLVAADGKLVGVAVATIRSSGIGLAIPAERLPPLAQGMAGPTLYELGRNPKGEPVLRVECWMIDPMSKVKSVSINYRLVDSSSAAPQAGTKLDTKSGSQTVDLKIEKHFAYGEAPLGTEIAGKKLETQTVVVNAAGAKVSEIASYEIKLPSAPPPTTARIVVKPPRTRHGKARVYVVRGGPAGGPQPDAPPGRNPGQQNEQTGDETAIIGGGGEKRFEDVGPDGAVLVGLDVGIGDDIRNDRVHAVRGIFRQGEKRIVSPWHGRQTERFVRIEANPGYAVGGMTIKPGSGIEGCGVTFMKIDGNKLNRRDSYESDWAGGYNGGDPQYLNTDGRLVVGLIGRENYEMCLGLGLSLLSANPPARILAPQRCSMPKSSKGVPNRSALVGNRGVAHYHDVAPEGSLLVGLDVGLMPFFDKELVRSITPIYRDGDKEPTMGEQHGDDQKKIVQLLAKPGYAIGAIHVYESNADGVKVIFMRVDNGRLDPRDSYESESVGEPRAEGWTDLNGEGHPVVGIIGAGNEKENTGLGLLFERPTSTGWEVLP